MFGVGVYDMKEYEISVIMIQGKAINWSWSGGKGGGRFVGWLGVFDSQLKGSGFKPQSLSTCRHP